MLAVARACSHAVTRRRGVQDAIECGCTEEQSEAERPELKEKMQEHLADFIHKHMPAANFDEILADGVKLSKLAKHLESKGQRKVDDAGGKCLEDLASDVVRTHDACALAESGGGRHLQKVAEAPSLGCTKLDILKARIKQALRVVAPALAARHTPS